jgi:capsular exopolysaccharide synthesis family protein
MSKLFEALQRSESERSGIPFLESNPLASEVLQATGIEETVQEFRSLIPAPTPDSRLVCMTDPNGLPAEKFRMLSVRLKDLRQSSAIKKILITSAVPGEGKTMCAVNLAACLAAQEQQNTLVIEGDLRRPGIREMLGLPPLAGLTDWFRGNAMLSDIIYRIDPPGFWFLPAGAPVENPIELMQAKKMSELSDHISSAFDWVLIDSTPVVAVADATVWAAQSDAVVLVAREGKTEKRPLRKALEIVSRHNLIGVVLNGSKTTTYNHYYQIYNPIQRMR